MNNFKEYGFKAHFEGEILKKIENTYFGYANSTSIGIGNEMLIPISWDSNGIAYGTTDLFINESLKRYKLTKIKPKWYETKDNIGKLLYSSKFQDIVIFCEKHNEELIKIRYNGCYYRDSIDTFQLLNKDTIEEYLVKE